LVSDQEKATEITPHMHTHIRCLWGKVALASPCDWYSAIFEGRAFSALSTWLTLAREGIDEHYT
jgi:hypothetical protein